MKRFIQIEFFYFLLVVIYFSAIFILDEYSILAHNIFATSIIITSFFALKSQSIKAEKLINSYQLHIRAETERKDTFVATIIHDLKNPILAQSRILETLIKKFKREHNKTDADILASMLNSSRLLFEMVSSILNTYKYSDCEIKYQFTKLDIVDLINSVCSELTYLSSEENSLFIEIKTNERIVIADNIHLRRVLSNLVSNALHYRREDTPVRVELSLNKNKIEFKTINKGYFIPPEKRAELFEKYVSKSSRFNSFGTGLGLFISNKIITAHQGEMFVDSTIDGTNTFGFRLPKVHFKNFVAPTKTNDDTVEV